MTTQSLREDAMKEPYSMNGRKAKHKSSLSQDMDLKCSSESLNNRSKVILKKTPFPGGNGKGGKRFCLPATVA